MLEVKVNFSIETTNSCPTKRINPILKRFYSFIFRERVRERERHGEKYYVREKYLLVASQMCSDWGLNPKPRHLPKPGIKQVIFHFVG